MNPKTVDVLTARVAGVTRRASLLTLGGAALATAITPDNKAKAKKTNRTCKKKCKQQGAQCRALTFDVCAGAADPAGCQAFFLPSCDALGRCNADPLLRQVIVLI